MDTARIRTPDDSHKTVRRLSGKSIKPPYRPTPRQGNQQTFFGGADSVPYSMKMPCLDCRKNHGIRSYQKFNCRKDGISLNIIIYAFDVKLKGTRIKHVLESNSATKTMY